MMSIGEFAKATGFSIKALRLYHARGLLSPAWVDNWTGYRYYDDESLERARIIRELRDLDFSLAEVAAILEHRDNSGDILRFLERQRAAIRARLHRYGTILQSLDATIEATREALMTQSKFDFDRDVERRLAQWLDHAQQQSTDEEPEPDACITISSLCGVAGAVSLAAVLGRRIGFDVWDEALVDAIASNQASRAKVLGALSDEQRAEVQVVLEEAPLADDLTEHTKARLEVMAALAVQGRAIFLELGSNFLLGPVPTSDESAPAPQRALRIRLDLPRDLAVAHYAAPKGLEIEDAERELEAREEALREFSASTFGGEVTAAGNYDLVLNSSSLDLYSAVDVVIQAYEARFSPEPGWWYRP